MMIIKLLFVPLLLILFIIKFKKFQRKLSTSQNVRHKVLQKLSAKFGQFFALSTQKGGTEFVTSDPAVVNEVFSPTKFMHFGDRKGFSSKSGHVFIASGDHWKQLRKRVTIFSKSKMKLLDPLLKAAVDSMLRSVAANEGKVFDFHKVSLHLIGAILARIAFCTASPHRPLGHFCETYTTIAEQLLALKDNARIFRALPQATKCCGSVDSAATQQQQLGNNFDMFMELYTHISEMEKQQHQQHPDGMPILDQNNPNNEDDGDQHDANQFACFLGKLFLGNAMKSVGIDTIGHCLAIVVHFMAQHSHVQHRLRHELLEERLPLLKAIINETLRLCPIVSFATSRCCTMSTSLNSNSVKLSVGDSVEVDVFTMGRSRTVWGEDADEFRPERWLHGGGTLPADWRRHWLPFGLGPRSCVGFPMAVHVLKMAIGDLFCRFHITPAGTEKDIQLVGSDVLWPDKVLVRAEPIQADETEDENNH